MSRERSVTLGVTVSQDLQHNTQGDARLFDEARIADGEPTVDQRGFAARLGRVIDRAAG